VERAAELLLAASAAHWAPVRHGDTLHDRASYRYHWQVLRRARRARAPLPDEIERTFFRPE
jgi:citrate lyase subunit beta/citryl-CoA lyase